MWPAKQPPQLVTQEGMILKWISAKSLQVKYMGWKTYGLVGGVLITQWRDCMYFSGECLWQSWLSAYSLVGRVPVAQYLSAYSLVGRVLVTK